MEAREPPATYSEYSLLPEDGPRYEIIGGAGVLTPAPGIRHQIVVENIHYLLSRYVRENNLGRIHAAPVDVALSETDVVQPDLLYIQHSRLGLVKARGIFGVPDLVVEVLSPSNIKWDLARKLDLYTRYGVREYWTADPDNRTVDLWVSVGSPLDTRQVISAGGTVKSMVLPGLGLPLAEIFAGMDEIPEE